MQPSCLYNDRTEDRAVPSCREREGLCGVGTKSHLEQVLTRGRDSAEFFESTLMLWLWATSFSVRVGSFLERAKTSQFKEISIRGDARLTTASQAMSLKQVWCPLFRHKDPPHLEHMLLHVLCWVWFGHVTRQSLFAQSLKVL